MRALPRYLLASLFGAAGFLGLGEVGPAASLASTPNPNLAEGATVPCSTTVAPAPTLDHVRAHVATGLLEPFGVAFAAGGEHLFVDSLINPVTPKTGPSPTSDASGISEYSVSASGLILERSGSISTTPLLGMANSPNGRDLVVAGGSGATVFSVRRMEKPESAESSWVLGSFTSRGAGAIESVVSPDGDDVFVSLEDSNELAVFNLQRAEKSGFRASDLVGYIPMGLAPVGLAVSPNGRYLYATSEVAPRTTEPEGTLSTIDLRRAERQPSRSVISTVWAGCNPVRVVATRSSVYVTARASDELLQFSAPDLIAHPGSALSGQVQVGEAPVGLALAHRDKMIVVADSNRFNTGGASSNLAVVTLSRKSLHLAGYLTAGDFPRDMSVNSRGTIMALSDFGSGDIQEVDLAGLP